MEILCSGLWNGVVTNSKFNDKSQQNSPQAIHLALNLLLKEYTVRTCTCTFIQYACAYPSWYNVYLNWCNFLWHTIFPSHTPLLPSHEATKYWEWLGGWGYTIYRIAGKFGEEFNLAVWRIIQGIAKLKSANIKFAIMRYERNGLVGVVYRFNVLSCAAEGCRRCQRWCSTAVDSNSSVFEMALYRYFALGSVLTLWTRRNDAWWVWPGHYWPCGSHEQNPPN